MDEKETKKVTIPACREHKGFHSIEVEVDWVCPECGGPRGEVFGTISYDGSRRLGVHGWRNPCGHVDGYADVRKEAKARKARLRSEKLRAEYERAYSLIRAAEFWRGMVARARSGHEKNMAQAMLSTVEDELREIDRVVYYTAHGSYMKLLISQLATNSIGARQTDSANPPRGTMRMLKNGWLRWQGGKLQRFDLERAS